MNSSLQPTNDSHREPFRMIPSKVQMLTSAIGSHPTVRVIQRKLNFAGWSHRRLSCDDQEGLEPLKDGPFLQRETENYREETFQYSKLHCSENNDILEGVKIPRKGNKAQESNLELCLVRSSSKGSSREEKQVCVPHENRKAHVMMEPQNISNIQTGRFQRSEKFSHKMLGTSPEVRKQQTSKTVDEELTPADSDAFESFWRETADPSPRVEKNRHAKKFQSKKLQLESEIVNDTQCLCDQKKNYSSGVVDKLSDASEAGKKELGVISDEKKSYQEKSVRKMDARNNNYGRRSCFGSSNNCLGRAKSLNSLFKPPGFCYSKLGGKEKDNPKVKKRPQTVKSAKKEGQLAKSPLERVPSWWGDKLAKERLSQRRSAVCDNIEKQLRDQYGISLRNLRKNLVMEEVLRECELI